MLERDNFWRSPWFVGLLAAFPALYLVLAAFSRLAAALLFIEEGPLIFLALGVPCWLSANAWHMAPTLSVRLTAALVVVLGEVLIGLCLFRSWWDATMPPNGAHRSVLGIVLVMMGVLIAQGCAGFLCLLLAEVAYANRPHQQGD